jgi:2-dehydropantoate 2-reductase
MARYIIYGAGGVGGLIGGRLHLAGHEVALVARGAHRAAIARSGLRLRTPAADDLIRLPIVETVSELEIGAEDVVILAMKTQDSAKALRELAAIAPAGISVVCAQNGVESERLALRLFEHVYGAYVFVFAAITEPGVVAGYSHPCHGVIDVGRYPAGTDARAAGLAADLTAAGFASEARVDIMAWKRGKLLINSGNVIQAACPPTRELDDVIEAARREGERCFQAAELPFVRADQVLAKGQELLALQTVAGRPFPGGSTAQGLARGSPDSEIDYLNGEIVLLGRTFGVPTPVNAFLQRLMRELLAPRAAGGSIAPAELRRRLEGA